MRKALVLIFTMAVYVALAVGQTTSGGAGQSGGGGGGGGGGTTIPNPPTGDPNSKVVNICTIGCTFNGIVSWAASIAANSVAVVNEYVCGDTFSGNVFASLFITVHLTPCAIPYQFGSPQTIGQADSIDCMGGPGQMTPAYVQPVQGCAIVTNSSFPSRIADPTSGPSLSAVSGTPTTNYTDVWVYYQWTDTAGGLTQHSPETHLSGISAGTQVAQIASLSFPAGSTNLQVFAVACATSCGTTNNGTGQEQFYDFFTPTAGVSGTINLTAFTGSGVIPPSSTHSSTVQGSGTNGTGAVFQMTATSTNGAAQQIYSGGAQIKGIAISCAQYASGSYSVGKATTGIWVGDAQELGEIRDVRINSCPEHGLTLEGYNGSGATGVDNFGPVDGINIDHAKVSGGICGAGIWCDPGAIVEGNTGASYPCTTHTAAIVTCAGRGSRLDINHFTITPNPAGGNTEPTQVGVLEVGGTGVLNTISKGNCGDVRHGHVEGQTGVILYGVEFVNCFGPTAERIQGLNGANAHVVHFDSTSYGNAFELDAQNSFNVCPIASSFDGVGCGGAMDALVPIMSANTVLTSWTGSSTAGRFFLPGVSGAGQIQALCTGLIVSGTSANTYVGYLSPYAIFTSLQACPGATVSQPAKAQQYMLPQSVEVSAGTAESTATSTVTVGVYDITQAKFMVSCVLSSGGTAQVCNGTNSTNWIAPGDTYVVETSDVITSTTASTVQSPRVTVRWN